jgi:hypothetical protein
VRPFERRFRVAERFRVAGRFRTALSAAYRNPLPSIFLLFSTIFCVRGSNKADMLTVDRQTF